MSIGQDRLTFFGVLAAIVVAVVGYFQIAKMYPVAGRTEAKASQVSPQQTDQHLEENLQEDAEAGATRPEEVVE